MREARRAFRRVACAMPRASACGSSWLSVESRRVALATIATPSRADAPRRRPVAAVRHATAAEAPATHWAGRQKARAALASATRLMSESDRASFAAYDVEFVVEISRCRAPLHRSTGDSHRHAADVEASASQKTAPQRRPLSSHAADAQDDRIGLRHSKDYCAPRRGGSGHPDCERGGLHLAGQLPAVDNLPFEQRRVPPAR